jgi:hypothetical protein
MKTRVWEGKEGEYLLPFDYAINGDGEIFLVKAGREDDGYFPGYYDDLDLVVEEGTDYLDKKNKEIFTGDLVKARSKRTNLYHIYEIKRIKGAFKFILEKMSFPESDLTEEEIVGNIHKKWEKCRSI